MYTLTTPQQNIWNLQKTFPNTSISNLCGALFFESRIDNCIIERAINKFIELHDGMRLQFREEYGEVMQYTAAYTDIVFPFNSFSDNRNFEGYAQQFSQTPFVMTDSPMYRFVIFELNGKSGVLACLNHLISDAWTFSLLAKGIYNLCFEFESYCISKRESHNYVDFIEAEKKYLKSERCQKDETYWTEVYSEKPEPCSIKLINTPVTVPTAQRFTTVLTAKQTEKINRYCKENGVSQAVLFEMSVFVYLARVNSDNKKITIGVPVLNRKTKNDKSTVGMYISTIPLTVEVSAEDTAAILSQRITDMHSQVFRHQRYPYSKILTQIRKDHQFTGNLYDVMVSFQNAKTDEDITTQWFTNGFSEVPFVLHIDNRDSAIGYTLNIDYQTEVFRNAEEVRLIVNRLMFIINQIIENFGITVGEINIVPTEEYQKVIFDFNDTAVDYPRDKCVHELFSEQAAKTPDKVALVFEDKKFTYRQLDEVSNSLANYLLSLNISKEQVIGVLLDRTEKVIISQLAVLKANLVFLPIDSRYPKDRVEYLINDCKIGVLLVDHDVSYAFPFDLKLIDLRKEIPKNITRTLSTSNLDDACYIIYTSGSTGQPKGCVLKQKSITNFCRNNNILDFCNSCRNHNVVSVNSISFDFFIAESLLPLANGYTVILSNESQSNNKAEFLKLVTENKVNMIFTTPTRLNIYTENEKSESYFNNIDVIVTSGEPLSEELLLRLSTISNAKIFNPLGPSECSVWNTDGSFLHIAHSPKTCVHELFSEQAAKTPDKIALVFEEKKFTYKQLNEMSNSLAYYLREEKGIKPNDIVPIIAKRSWHIIVAMFGILKAGGSYMPVDPTYPIDRIEYMLSETRANIALVCGFTDNLSVEILDLEEFDYKSNCMPIINANQSDDKCYVLFTSGTTGKPKATIVTHRNLGNFVDNNSNNVYQCNMLNTYHAVLASGIYTFDISVFEIHLTLLNGLAVVMSNEEENISASLLAGLIEKNSVDVIHSTPTKMAMLLENADFQRAAKYLKMLMIGAEVFTEETYKTIRKYTDAVIYNGYGPSESTVACSFKKIVTDADITIGKPIANTQIYILDKDRKPLPIGVAGELCISGDGVGKGYLNRPELTAEKFISNPFLEGKTMYCTGDLARWRADGELEYLGRIDTQVKIRGLRIELGEIESVMSSFDGIRLTAVTDKRDENNRQYLVGYYTAETKVDEKLLRQHLSAKLPKYMIPNYFVHLAEMPMTSSGKIDRKNLPLPNFTQSKNEYVAPETDTEKMVAEIWSKLLNVENVGKNDDFYDLGGDSLLAISLLNYLENAFGTEITMKDILENPILESLAEKIDRAEKKHNKITVTNSNRYVLLPQQKAIYAVCSKNPTTLMYNMPTKIKLDSGIDRKKLKSCFHKIMNVHRSLKTYIKSENDEIYGIYDSKAELHFEEYSDSDISGFIRPFDLSKAPLIRIGFTESSMLFDMHHIIADGESLNIILRDLTKLYYGEKVEVNKTQYADYAEYFHNSDFSEHKSYFKDMLKCDFEPIVLPEKKHQSEAYGISKIYQLNEEIFVLGRKFARENGITDTMLFLGIYGILLSKFTAKPKLLSSIVLTNRTHKETQNVLGMFVNTLPIMINASGTVSEYYSRIKDLLLNLFEYQELPFFDIAEAVEMTDKSVINTSFIYQADGIKKLSVDNAELAPEFIDTHTSKFDLTFELTPNESGCMLRIEYNSGKYEEELINKLFTAYERIISQLDKETVAEISVLSEEEYQKVIFDFNDTAVDYPKDKCIHELFSEQAAKTPDKVALVFEDKKFTYRQLDEMSNSLAHYLREEKDIKSNDIVPIISKRSWHVIVAMLGVLKAGGAYMPVDPTYPIDRIEYMIDEVKSNIALVCGFKRKLSVPSLELEDFDYNFNRKFILSKNGSNHKCYVMFTSGTTGKAKATVVTHQNLSNFVNNVDNNMYQFNMLKTCSTALALTTYTFDISVFEIYLSLLNGLTVVMSNDKESVSASLLAALIEKNSVDVIHSTPTKMAMLLENADFQRTVKGLKMLMMGAETFTEDFHNKIRKYTDAVVYNGYGPTETTIGVSFKRIDGSPYVVHELFCEQSSKTPDKIALVFEDKKFTYRQLDDMSNSLAHYLREEKGIKPNDIVPIIAKRSWHIIVAMLGILKAGGAYMPVDPTYPIDRIEYMIDEAKSKAALVFGYDEKLSINTVNLDGFDYEYQKKKIKNLNVTDDLCYLIFTSGSTGKPKATMITHANVRNYTHNNNNVVFKIIKEEYTSIVSVTNIVFDIFVTESILPILNGLTIYFASDEEVFSQEKLSDLINNNEIDVMQTTPTKMKGYMLDKNNLSYLSKLKTIILGGEALTADLCQELKKYTDSEIYNIYGPAETTVWSTNAQVTSVDITIGKPIANTQIYILDKDRKPLPIGVAGELCISGDGVGKGYLNRPKLTAEKFIPNPFIEGKTMYCTGDLARWRADGELEYLGRIDTQVKIRGLRIELGEIESVMSSFDGIRLTAVTDKRDENNRQYLIGYYTSETEIDEKLLRQHLSAKLPKYMIPNYFVHLAEMPMTASGKTDRKNLPLPDFTQSKNEYVAPRTETEIKLCNLLTQLFNIENVGVTDDFFELGGDSLKAIEYIAKAHNIGVEINLQDVFDYPTVRELCDIIANGTEKVIEYSKKDFEKYKEVLSRNVLDKNFEPKKKSLGNILLTGATGFLGAHILDSFMREETGKIYCLVRSDSSDDRRGRWKEILNYYFGRKYVSEFGQRIVPVVGDITNTILSDNIPNDVQTVIHTAATVKHYGSYKYFHEVNVQGTKNVIAYAKRIGARLLHISTISVSGNSFADAFTIYRSEEEKHFDEKSLYIEQELDNVYIRSKFEAERAVLDAVLEGLDAKIVRVGNLTNRASDFKFQPNYEQNAFLTRIKAALEFGQMPEYLMPLYAEFSPIDETAEGVIRIAQYADKQNIFHLNSNKPIYFTRLLEVLEKLNISMEIVSGEEFRMLLQEYAKNSETEYIYEAFQNDMDENGNLVYDSNIRIINDFTVQFLKNVGFEWTQIDFEYIKGYVEYFKNIGYLEV